jgi:hypothetical protein
VGGEFVRECVDVVAHEHQLLGASAVDRRVHGEFGGR